MPIFEFECRKCGKRFEELVRSQSQKLICPGCKSASVKKLFSTFAFASKDPSGNITSSSKCSGCTSGNCSGCRG